MIRIWIMCSRLSAGLPVANHLEKASVDEVAGVKISCRYVAEFFWIASYANTLNIRADFVLTFLFTLHRQMLFKMPSTKDEMDSLIWLKLRPSKSCPSVRSTGEEESIDEAWEMKGDGGFRRAKVARVI